MARRGGGGNPPARAGEREGAERERFKNPTSEFVVLYCPPEYVGDPNTPQVGETFDDFRLRKEHEAEVLEQIKKKEEGGG